MTKLNALGLNKMHRYLSRIGYKLIGASVLFCVAAGLVRADEPSATFELVVDIHWNSGTTPVEFPENAHMSGMIGVTHNARYVLFDDGRTASSGLELLAENGRATILLSEFAEAQRRERIGTQIKGDGLASVPGTIRTTFEATIDHPLLSFVTMLAPSPDWFTGAADMPLMVNDAWIDSAERVLWVWDSGTDSGTTYLSPNVDTQPRESIRLLSTPHFLTPTQLVAIGTARIQRIQKNAN